MEDAKYKVLWIDDQPELVDGYKFWAALRSIKLLHRESWADAIPVLEKDFNELTAIILDANCKYNTTDKSLDEGFLGDVLQELKELFGKRHRFIPWYILSAGTMSNFSIITNVVIGRERRELEKEWGATVYLKNDFENQGENSPLFDCIRRVGDCHSNNIVLFRHRDVFKYMGAKTLICEDARKIMLKALAVLYYPEENMNYEFAGNPIRKVVEYMFKSAYKYGLLTDVFLDERGNIRIWDSMQYLCGMDPSPKSNLHYRFGKKGEKSDYSDYESVFPTSCYYSFRGLLNYVNVDSHTFDEDGDSPYRIDAESKDLFHAYVFLLCHLITCFGKYVDQHHDVQENKSKLTAIADKKTIKKAKEPQVPKPEVVFTRNETAKSFIGKVFPVINMREFPTVGGCKIAKDLSLKVLQLVRIDEVAENTGTDAKEYPFIVTKVTPQE